MTVLDPVVEYLMKIYAMQGSRRVLSLDKIMAGAERPRRPVLRVLDKLTREGYLEQVSDTAVPSRPGEGGRPERSPEWRIVRDLTDRPKTRVLKNTMRAKIWRLIRAKRYFSKHDLVITSGVQPATVDEYVRLLEKGGYIRRTGKDGRLVTYMLVKNVLVYPALDNRRTL